ncbi:SubName: Full=Uncharacterized protein {ECO:0000313/EMBL:CCA68427.1} [Serendipita indica DSM 11827]|nr:SubName: Full=Uncharacterized protein {ECO:0000313/EMBL:CCA68427.1} [Serendipita indica DSM 11827]
MVFPLSANGLLLPAHEEVIIRGLARPPQSPLAHQTVPQGSRPLHPDTGVYYVPAMTMTTIAVPHDSSHYLAGYDPSSSPSYLQSLHLNPHHGRPSSNTARDSIPLSKGRVSWVGSPPADPAKAEAPTEAPSNHQSSESPRSPKSDPIKAEAPTEAPSSHQSPKLLKSPKSDPAKVEAPTGAPSSHQSPESPESPKSDPAKAEAPTEAPSSHQSPKSNSQSPTKSSGFLSFLGFRFKSKQRKPDDALYPASNKSQREIMQEEEEAALAKRKNDQHPRHLDNPSRPRTVRRQRPHSFDGQRALERQQRRNRDLDPDVQENTRYNATSLKYIDGPLRPSRGRSDYHGGYATDVQPPRFRRNSMTTAHAQRPSSIYSFSHPTWYSLQLHSSHGIDQESHAPALKGWFNQRGDELIYKNTVICQERERQYSPRFKNYPPVGQGFGDSRGNIIDINGRLLKRVGRHIVFT